MYSNMYRSMYRSMYPLLRMNGFSFTLWNWLLMNEDGKSVKYRVSIKSFPDYKHLLQENYVEYRHIFLNFF